MIGTRKEKGVTDTKWIVCSEVLRQIPTTTVDGWYEGLTATHRAWRRCRAVDLLSRPAAIDHPDQAVSRPVGLLLATNRGWDIAVVGERGLMNVWPK